MPKTNIILIRVASFLNHKSLHFSLDFIVRPVMFFFSSSNKNAFITTDCSMLGSREINGVSDGTVCLFVWVILLNTEHYYYDSIAKHSNRNIE